MARFLFLTLEIGILAPLFAPYAKSAEVENKAALPHTLLVLK